MTHFHRVGHIYAPNIENMQFSFYDKLNGLFCEKDFETKERIIVGGDFNCVLDSIIYKKGGIAKTKKSVADKIKNLTENYDLVDIWREL